FGATSSTSDPPPWPRNLPVNGERRPALPDPLHRSGAGWGDHRHPLAGAVASPCSGTSRVGFAARLSARPLTLPCARPEGGWYAREAPVLRRCSLVPWSR